MDNLSESDLKILLSCIEPRSRQDISAKTGISFAYCNKRITKLRARGYLYLDESAKTPRYLTVRRLETEALWGVIQSGNNAPVAEIQFYGKLNTYAEALNRVMAKHKGLKGNTTLRDVIGDTLAVLKVKSFRKDQGLTSQRPTVEEMRTILEDYVSATVWELDLAKELLKHDYLWADSDTLWKFLSEGEPKPSVLERYTKANDKYCPSPKVN